MPDIIANILHMSGGDSSISPLPISVEVTWILPLPAGGTVGAQQGICQLMLDPALNRNQMEANLREQLAACVTEVVGVLFVASDVRGISI